jgi:hypothetical protein
MALYRSAWWSLELPAGWTGREDEDCHTFEGEGCVGALQISAHRKDSEPVSDDDLREFAGDIPLHELTLGAFSGFRTRFSADDVFWMKWWLRSGTTMLHVTYNCALEERDEKEEASVERALGSLATL